jgi:hypothetical protein
MKTTILLAPSKMFSLQGKEAYNMRWQTEGYATEGVMPYEFLPKPLAREQ